MALILVHHLFPTFGINGSFGAPRKKTICINFNKSKTKLLLSSHYDCDSSCLFVNGKKIYKSKSSNKNVNFLTEFCLGSISNQLNYVESEKVSFKGNVYDFSVDYDTVCKSDTLGTHNYLMVNDYIK